MVRWIGRWLPLLFLVSLAGNLFLGAMIASEHRSLPINDPVRVLERIEATLTRDDAAIVRKAIDAHGTFLIAERDRRKTFRRDLAEVLRAEPFDRTALATLLEENEASQKQFRRRVRESFVEAAATVSPEARRQIAAFEEKGLSYEH